MYIDLVLYTVQGFSSILSFYNIDTRCNMYLYLLWMESHNPRACCIYLNTYRRKFRILLSAMVLLMLI